MGLSFVSGRSWRLDFGLCRGGFILFLFAGFYFRSPLWRIWQQFTRESLIILGGFAAIVAGAVGFEIIYYLFLRSDSMTNLHHLEIAIEEFLEMAGSSIILYASLEIAAALCSEESVQEGRTTSSSYFLS